MWKLELEDGVQGGWNLLAVWDLREMSPHVPQKPWGGDSTQNSEGAESLDRKA
jgi:hypothetical protein